MRRATTRRLFAGSSLSASATCCSRRVTLRRVRIARLRVSWRFVRNTGAARRPPPAHTCCSRQRMWEHRTPSAIQSPGAAVLLERFAAQTGSVAVLATRLHSPAVAAQLHNARVGISFEPAARPPGRQERRADQIRYDRPSHSHTSANDVRARREEIARLSAAAPPVAYTVRRRPARGTRLDSIPAAAPRRCVRMRRAAPRRAGEFVHSRRVASTFQAIASSADRRAESRASREAA